MIWEDLEIDNLGQVYYKGIEVELSCINIMNLINQGNIKESLDKEVIGDLREIKIDIILSGR